MNGGRSWDSFGKNLCTSIHNTYLSKALTRLLDTVKIVNWYFNWSCWTATYCSSDKRSNILQQGSSQSRRKRDSGSIKQYRALSLISLILGTILLLYRPSALSISRHDIHRSIRKQVGRPRRILVGIWHTKRHRCWQERILRRRERINAEHIRVATISRQSYKLLRSASTEMKTYGP
jgi:hypothetical protein